jgi:16S rRNA (uracil1498-N3)-methyltransferase
VLRLGPGDEVLLFDGSGNAAQASIQSVEGAVTCEAGERFETEPGAARVVLMLAIPKGSKLEDCVRMATELGVDEIALMRTERTVPQWDLDRARSRIERLTRICAEAAAQCERNDIPIIRAPVPWQQCLQRVPSDGLGVLFGARAHGSIRLDHKPSQLWCAIGPEGGFTTTEMTSFEEAGFVVASLGRRILRVDTAVAAALTLAQDRLQTVLQAR